MGWREAGAPLRMQRVALVVPEVALRDMLVQVADAGTVELDLVADEAELRAVAATAVVRDEVAALAGWLAESEVATLTERLRPVGAAVVPMPAPRGVDPPTALRRDTGARRAFIPLVETYGTVPYADVDPAVLAGLAYMLMFGMMFGDAGHGALLVSAGLLLRAGRSDGSPGSGSCGRSWPGAGVAAIGLRAALRGVLRPHRRAPGALALAAGGAGHPAGRGRRGSGAVLLAGAYAPRHRQPVARGRLAAGAELTRRAWPAPRCSPGSA